MFFNLLNDGDFLFLVDLHNRFQNPEIVTVFARRMMDCLNILGETAAAVADSGKQKTLTNPRIGPDTPAYIINICTQTLTDNGYLDHKDNLSSQHRNNRIIRKHLTIT